MNEHTKEFNQSFVEFSSNNSQGNSSFLVQKKRKNKKAKDEMKYVEYSPNYKFSRSDIRKYSEKHYVAYSGLDNDRGCEIIWHELNVASINDEKTDNLFKELCRLKMISKEDCINTITEVWLRDDKHVIVFISDCFGMGTVRQYLAKIGKQKLKVIKGWITTLLCSLTFLHESRLVFGDLNCSRILFNGTIGTLAIKDLYVASDVFYDSFYEKAYEIFSPNCMCPELINHLTLNEKSDLYSLGMVIIEVITLEIPYSDIDSPTEIMNMISRGIMPNAYERIMDDGVKRFLQRILEYDPNNRPSIKELLDDDFLKVTKDDYRIVKVSSSKRMKTKKKSIQELNNEDLNTKNFLLCKEFKEEPYSDSVHKDFDKRIIFDNNNTDLKNKKYENIIKLNPIENDDNFNYNNYNHYEIDNESETKEYKNLAANDPSYQIVDEDYNILLKILINEEGKVNEIEFKYNLLKDTINSLMEEIKSEFNLSHDNLNHIYETLKKVQIYSKLCKCLELFPDNSC